MSKMHRSRGKRLPTSYYRQIQVGSRAERSASLSILRHPYSLAQNVVTKL